MMERMTERSESGHAYYPQCFYNGPHTTGANDFCSHGQKREEGEIEDDP